MKQNGEGWLEVDEEPVNKASSKPNCNCKDFIKLQIHMHHAHINYDTVMLVVKNTAMHFVKILIFYIYQPNFDFDFDSLYALIFI